MKVAIRVDASQAIGTGHVRRCLSLAHALREAGSELRFVTRDLGVDSASLIKSAGFETVVLATPDGHFEYSSVPHAAWAQVDAERDVADSISALVGWAPDWVLVDHYAFDAKWHTAIRAGLGSRIAVIDDLADRAIDADLLVDHNYMADSRAKYANRLSEGTVLLGGPRFALLGPAFAKAPRHELCDVVKSVGIFLGGVDIGNVTATVIAAIDRSGFNGPIEIVSTNSNPHLENLRELVANRPGTTLITDLPDLTEFFARHGIQVGAGGGATWERFCIGAPTLLLMVAENQHVVVSELSRDGLVVTPRPLDTLEVERIAEVFGEMLTDTHGRAEISKRTRALVDGLGARRVALRLLSETVQVRAARANDALLMYVWRNHPATRSVSRNRDEIGWAEHLAWITRALRSPDQRLMIGMVGQIPIGVIRLDKLAPNRAEVSLYLDPDLHGLRLGGPLLLAAEQAVVGLDIVAEVMEGNHSSARMFKSAGYQQYDRTHWIKPANGRMKVN